MTQSFRIYGGKNERDESDETVLAAVTPFKWSCNICGKEGHKADDCPNKLIARTVESRDTRRITAGKLSQTRAGDTHGIRRIPKKLL
jgi:hypothetical protein